MNKICTLFFTIISLSVFSQNDIVLPLEDFKELKVYNGLQVNLIKSEEQKLEIIGERAAEVSVKNRKGKLKIYLDLVSSFNTKKVQINLYYTANITELNANQGAIITSNEVFKQMQLNLVAEEGSYIKLNIEVDYLKAKAVTGGTIQLKGSTKSQNIDIVSGSNYTASYLKSELATLYVSTGSNAKVTVHEILDAKAKLGGVIEYGGRPKSVTIEESLGGKVMKKQENTAH